MTASILSIVPYAAHQTAYAAARSTHVTIVNITQHTLHRIGASLDHSCWTNDQLPADTI
jgi:hypothetical protein